MSNWKSIAGTVGRIAGAVAPLLGGPVGMAASIGAQIAGALGTDNRPDAVLRELTQNPEATLTLQQWAHEEREQIRQANIRLQELELAQAQTELADIQHARESHREHWMPERLTLLLALMVVALTIALMAWSVPDGSKEVVFYLVGQIVTAFLAAVTYWLGSSRGSAEKQKKLEQLTGGALGTSSGMAGSGHRGGRPADRHP